MRERMFKEHQFDSAVFIGGMGGIIEEFDLFTAIQPKARVYTGLIDRRCDY